MSFAARLPAASPIFTPPIKGASSRRASSSVETADGATRPPLRLRLADDELGAGERGDLREVGDAKDLTVPRDLGDRPPDHLGDRAADAGVQFVEDDMARPAGPQQRFGEDASPRARESSPPLAMRSRGPRVLSLVGGDEELDPVNPAPPAEAARRPR